LPSKCNSQTTIKESLQHRKHFLDSSAHFLDFRAFNAIDDDGQIFHRSIVRCSRRLRDLQPILRIEMLEAVPWLPMHFDLAIEEQRADIGLTARFHHEPASVDFFDIRNGSIVWN